MEYRVRVWSAMHGPGVPLRYVAEAMAKRAATGYGTLPLHGPTLENLRPEHVRLVWEAAMRGRLTVCDSHGRVASATELIETASASVAEVTGAASSAYTTAENNLPYLFASQQDLIKWGETSGDVFLFVETPGTLVNSDLRNFTEAGFGEVIEAGYWIGAVRGGESKPWRDDLYDTAPCGTKPAQSSAATPAPVAALGDEKQSIEGIRYEVLASRTQLIEAFSYYGVELKIFRALKDRPGLKAACRVKGKGQKGSRAEPMFCPFEVVNWLVKTGVKEKPRLKDFLGWHILQTKFPAAYAEKSMCDPR